MSTAVATKRKELPVPKVVISPTHCKEIYQVNYGDVATRAREWAKKHDIKSAATDKFKIAVLLIDNQIDFCMPNGALYVEGAEHSSSRIASWLYRNLDVVTTWVPTMDTHYREQVFHEAFLVDQSGNHVPPYTPIPADDILNGKWRVDPGVAYAISGKAGAYGAIQKHLEHYVNELKKAGKYTLYIWPYHCMLGGIGHALVPVIAEAIAFHGFARCAKSEFGIKGGNALTENYSIFAPEVLTTHDGRAIAQRNTDLMETLLNHDAVFIMGQAKSHCVAWSISDLLTQIKSRDESLAKKVWIVEDCMDPVVVPNVVDFTAEANKAIADFKDAGMNVVTSSQALHDYLPI